jgi:hypothetical protein
MGIDMLSQMITGILIILTVLFVAGALSSLAFEFL